MRISPALQAFLSLISWSEGTSTSRVTQDNGYDVIVSGVDGPHRMTDYDDHPFASGRPPIIVRLSPLLKSTASGRYQLILPTWKAYKSQLQLLDFGHASQDAVAAQMIAERDALDQLNSGNVEGAISLCSNLWASFPGNSYGQGGKQIGELLEKYQQFEQQLTSNANSSVS